MDVHCRDKHVATDTIYFDTIVINDGSACNQLFVDQNSLV